MTLSGKSSLILRENKAAFPREGLFIVLIREKMKTNDPIIILLLCIMIRSLEGSCKSSCVTLTHSRQTCSFFRYSQGLAEETPNPDKKVTYPWSMMVEKLRQNATFSIDANDIF